MHGFIPKAGYALLTICFLLTACSTDTTAPNASEPDLAPVYRNGDVIPGQYIVVLNDNEIAGKGENLQSFTHGRRLDLVRSITEAAANRIGLDNKNIGATFGSALHGAVMTLTDDQVNQLRRDKTVKYIEQDRYVSLPPLVVQEDAELSAGKKNNGTGTSPSSQSTPWGITMVGGYETPSTGMTVWIVDTGIDLDHGDLNVNTSKCKNYVTTGTNTTTADDGHGHGTHCAGIVGAKNNTIGVVGVAPGVALVAMRVLNENGSGSFSWSISAFDHITANATSGDVVNYSVGPGSRYSSSSLDNAVTNMASAGIKVCIAAGNQTDDCAYYSPAKVNATNVYTIAAMGSTKGWMSFSNYGTPVDWIEPGSNITSTYKNNGYASMSGTSMASPHAAGILAVGGITSGGSVSNVPSGTVSSYGKRD